MKHVPVKLWLSSRIGLAAAAITAASFVAGVRVNVSASVPRGLYLQRGLGAEGVKRGDYVLLPTHAPASPSALRSGEVRVAHRTLIKRVEGLAGDEITRDELVAVNGRSLPNSRWRPHDAQGRSMPRPALPLRLGQLELWLGSSHPKGIDSRYFGPVNVSALAGIAEPLWTF